MKTAFARARLWNPTDGHRWGLSWAEPTCLTHGQTAAAARRETPARRVDGQPRKGRALRVASWIPAP
eukprot:366211-Chlamydomonas_euryale.AAC.9